MEYVIWMRVLQHAEMRGLVHPFIKGDWLLSPEFIGMLDRVELEVKQRQAAWSGCSCHLGRF